MENNQAGRNIRELALNRRIKAVSYFISAFFVFFGSFVVILNFKFPPIFYLLFMIIALWLIANGAFLWKRANHADQGAKGEEDIAQALSILESQGWQLEYGMRLGNGLGDLDVFCISPQGKAFAIEVKSHRGEVISDGQELFRRMGNKKYPFEKNFITQAMKQALKIKQQKDLDFVTPILAFSTARVSIQGDKFKNVYVVEKAKLVSLLKSLG
jgi:Holliday junction resolvase-like predicted endonuclease